MARPRPLATWLSTRMPGPPGISQRVIRPGEGAKVSGSSALMRHSKAWPRQATSSCVTPSASPRATRMPSATMSMPGRHLGHRMLDLHARVHLDEEEGAVLDQELERADAPVADLPAGLGATLANLGHEQPGETRAPAPPPAPSGAGAGASSRGCRARARGRDRRR